MQTKLFTAIFSVTTFASAFAQAPSDRLTIDLEKPGTQVSPLLYGVFFEEINRAGEGGIYAEMVQNRSFEDAGSPVAWRAQAASIALDKSLPINANNPTSLRVQASAGGGVSNGGFVRDWQDRNEPGRIAVRQGKTYDLTLYARSDPSTTLSVALRGANRKVLASQNLSGIESGWKQFTLSLTPSETDAYCRLIITSDQAATFWLDMVSLFPHDTWKGRKNGLRPDLMEAIVAMKPAFVRFPGGCFVEGMGIQNRAQWKQTIGEVAQRPGHMNANWGYFSSDGLGYHEYLQMCEDLNAEPMFVINCGMGHDPKTGMFVVPMDKMGPYVQDALDAIEYANGPATSTWGAQRAKNGHPQPFNMQMIEIGNENGGPDYIQRYKLFHDAIKARYPEMKLISTEMFRGPDARYDIADLHDYNDVSSFLKNATQFDSADRNGPRIYIGEYAMTADAGKGTLQAGLAEAAYMTGLERNSDVVTMSSYAPLLCNPDWRAWNPNAILFDQSQYYGTPSYWVQAMFAANRADQIYPVEMQIAPPASQAICGKIGVGTYATQAEFKDIKVVRGEEVLLQSDFSKGTSGFHTARGRWTTQDGVLRQTSDEGGTLAIAGDANWQDYTLTLKARKLSGKEGFLVTFGTRGESRRSWWNIGGWGNRQHGIESDGLNPPRVAGAIETGRWYDIKVELQGTRARFYLDGQLIHDLTRAPQPTFAAVAGKDQKTGETILKFVNASAEPRTVSLDLRGAKAGSRIAGSAWVLTSANARDENSFDTPDRIVPREQQFTADVSGFTCAFPANSLTILRWK